MELRIQGGETSREGEAGGGMTRRDEQVSFFAAKVCSPVSKSSAYYERINGKHQ